MDRSWHFSTCNCKNLLTKPNAHISWMLSVWQSQKKYYSFPREMSKFHSCPTGWAVGVNIHYSGSAPSPLPTHGAIAYRNGVHFCQYILQSRGRVQSQAELGHSAVFSSLVGMAQGCSAQAAICPPHTPVTSYFEAYHSLLASLLPPSSVVVAPPPPPLDSPCVSATGVKTLPRERRPSCVLGREGLSSTVFTPSSRSWGTPYSSLLSRYSSLNLHRQTQGRQQHTMLAPAEGTQQNIPSHQGHKYTHSTVNGCHLNIRTLTALYV